MKKMVLFVLALLAGVALSACVGEKDLAAPVASLPAFVA